MKLIKLLFRFCRLSEKIIEVDPVFCKLLIPVSLCSREDHEIKDITAFTQNKPPNTEGKEQGVTQILLFLKSIEKKPSYARRIETAKLLISLKVQCSTKKKKGFSSPICVHAFPPIFSEWKDFVHKVEFHCAYDILEPIDFLLAQFPKLEILSLTKVFSSSPQQLSNLNSQTLVQLELKSDFFGNGAYYDINAATDFGLPNLKYLSLIGKNCFLYDEILERYGGQLVGLNYLISDSANTEEREFLNLKYLCYSCRTDLPWFCPNLEFISLTYNSPVLQELPKLKYLAYTMAVPFITEVIRTNKQEHINLYLMGSNYNLPPQNYCEG